jgi:hypothetical protein
MTKDDVPGAKRGWHAAYTAMRTAHHLPTESDSPEQAQRQQDRITHLLQTDPSGSFVAVDEDNDHVVGISQALVRDDLWVLSLLGVSPRC